MSARKLLVAAVITGAALLTFTLVPQRGGTHQASPTRSGRAPADPAPSPRPTRRHSSAVARYGVFEQAFSWNSTSYTNPWEQVDLEMQLTAPSGRRYEVGGFYDAPNLWEARFAPSELGRWTWRAGISDGRRRASFGGAFRVVAGTNPGFVRPRAGNPFRWSFSNGSPYYPLGIGTCVYDVQNSGSPLNWWGFDGGFRPPGIHTPGTYVDTTTFVRAFSGGINLFRWSVDNCAFPLYQTIDPSGNVYGQQDGMWGDELVQSMRRFGIRVYMTFFNKPPFADNPSSAQIAAIERYVKYVVDRYGPYVDFWELMNESSASASWYAQIGAYLHRVDPYHHPVSTSNERPDLSVIDVSSPHWYESESEFDSDVDTWQRFSNWKRAGKPVIVGEQGNTGQNWDQTSGLRMRLRAWTTFFAEGTLIFWDASFAKDYRNAGAADLYMGPEERGYLRVLQRFTNNFDPHARITTIGVSDPSHARAYALRGPRQYAAYLHAYTNHSSATTGVAITIDVPSAGTATWSSPATGAVLGRARVHAGTQTIAVPSFVTDIALKVQ